MALQHVVAFSLYLDCASHISFFNHRYVDHDCSWNLSLNLGYIICRTQYLWYVSFWWRLFPCALLCNSVYIYNNGLSNIPGCFEDCPGHTEKSHASFLYKSCWNFCRVRSPRRYSAFGHIHYFPGFICTYFQAQYHFWADLLPNGGLSFHLSRPNYGKFPVALDRILF